MAPEYFTDTYMARIAPYIAPLTPEERQVYCREGEGALHIRAAEGIDEGNYLNLVQEIGVYLNETSGPGFSSDYQTVRLSDDITLASFQLPGGGNLNVFSTPDGKMVLDTGYGCFYNDCETMLERTGFGGFSDVRAVICTHADADHCGAAGYFSVPPLMHPVTKAILDAGTRGFGSPNGKELLEKFYTTTINTMSRMNIPDSIISCDTQPLAMRAVFPVIEHVSFAGMHFEVWESLGGHIAGQMFLYEPTLGVLFTSDALINFATLSKERADYSSIADEMIGSVNVNSEIARKERRELMRIAAELDAELKKKGTKLTICCGHGAISRLNEDGKLVMVSTPVHYDAASYGK